MPTKNRFNDRQDGSDRPLREFEAVLERRHLRLTPLREAVAQAVAEKRGHFGIDALVAELRAKGVRVSHASIYRILPLLSEAGILLPAGLAGDRGSYEAVTDEPGHEHLVCTGCGTVVEFAFEAFAILRRELARRHGFRLTSHRHELFGLCAACGKENGTELVETRELTGLCCNWPGRRELSELTDGPW